MATVTKHTIQDGEKNLIVKIHVTGATDLADEVLIDASTYTPTFTDCALMRVQSSFPNVTGATAAGGPTLTLEWDATADVPLIEVSGQMDLDFSSFGGIPNNAGAGVTGDILGTTTGMGANISGFVILHIRKK